MNHKVAVIGLDGMSWPLLNKLFEYNAMPTLRRITKNSSNGVLVSTIPPLSPLAWTNIASGVNPGKHGVFNFIRFTKNYETRIMSSEYVCYPRLHEMVALKGLKSVCINQPITYPLIKIKKSMVISDWIAPRLDCYPKSLQKYMHNYASYALDRKIRDNIRFLPKLYEYTKKRVDTVNRMMKQLDWDLFWVIYSEPDVISHFYYKKVIRGDISLLKIFEALDETIKKASELSDIILIVSDHGFAEYKFLFCPNCFLDRLGLISKTKKQIIKKPADIHVKHHKLQFNLPTNFYNLFSIEPLRTFVKKTLKLISKRNIKIQTAYVDPKRSKAFLTSDHGIHVKTNTDINTIESELRKLNFIKQVFVREKIYNGAYVKKAPHILFTYKEGYTTRSGSVLGRILQKFPTYKHHRDGIIIVHGQDVEIQKLGRIVTCDIVPTILNYLGLPLPNDTDGKHIPCIPVKQIKPKTFNYLNHWQLIKKIHQVKRKLSKIS